MFKIFFGLGMISYATIRCGIFYSKCLDLNSDLCDHIRITNKIWGTKIFYTTKTAIVTQTYMVPLRIVIDGQFTMMCFINLTNDFIPPKKSLVPTLYYTFKGRNIWLYYLH